MRFIGSKDSLIEFIWQTILDLRIKGEVFFDIFSGTTRVAQYFKKKGYTIISNDNLYFSYLLQRTYIENNTNPKFALLTPGLQQNGIYDDSKTELENVFDHLNNVRGIKDYVFENYAKGGKYERMYFSDENAQKIDGILLEIESWHKDKLITALEESILRASLVESLPFVSNISGTYGAYLKYWEKRALNPIVLKIPELIPSTKQHHCFQMDFNDIIGKFDVDILYIDPPYNDRQYISNYHVLETVARDDKIELKGKTGLRTDDHLYKSRFSQKNHCVEALEDLISKARARYILMSYNSEGIIPGHQIERIFKEKGSNYKKLEENYRRFKSHSNGIPKKGVIEHIYYVQVQKPRYYSIDRKHGLEVATASHHRLQLQGLAGKDNLNISGRFGVDYGQRGIYDLRNDLNDLTGREWVYRTNSIEIIDQDPEEIRVYDFIKEIIETKYSTRGDESFSYNLRSRISSPKPPQLMKMLIEFFTKENEWILDPFMGVGGTLLGASLSNRKAVGIDLSEDYIEIYRQVCHKENLKEQIAIAGDSRDIAQFPEVSKRIFDLILTDPPYSNMMTKRKTGEATKRGGNTEPTPFTTCKEDIGNEPLPVFLEELKTIISKSCDYLKSKGYLLIFTKDFQPTNEYHGMLHSDIVHKLLDISYLRYKGYKIWYDKTVNLYPYGYPYAYVGNQLHQFILIFRKEGAKGKK